MLLAPGRVVGSPAKLVETAPGSPAGGFDVEASPPCILLDDAFSPGSNCVSLWLPVLVPDEGATPGVVVGTCAPAIDSDVGRSLVAEL